MTSRHEPIAIIGNACRFPGDATSPSKLWELLKAPRDVSRRIDRFQSSSFYNRDGHYHGASNVQDSYLLSEDPRLFDAQFFNIPPGEAESIDPQQRLILETVYEAVESSGLVLEALRGSNTAVYVGIMCDDYGNICYADPESIPTYAATGTARSILSNRVSFVFDWRGPSMTIDTACSSSLVAIHQAVQVLRSGSSSVAVAAGANLIFSPHMYIAESNLNMLSATGKSQMWDANANGYARGEGMAAVILKRLSDAIADGDHIECVIRETGVNQDGHTPGITMPSQEAQTQLIRDTYARAGLNLSDPRDRPQYFEAHGTGTKAGDGVESKAIFHAFFPPQSEGITTPIAEAEAFDHLWVGSIKTVIGHTEGTAGVAGVLKACLAIQNKTIPPNLHFNNLNPDVAPYYGKLQIAKTAEAWPSLPAGAVRRASVNSFGFGGTNAHAILEAFEPAIPEAFLVPATPSQQIARKTANPLPLAFSATSEQSLTKLMSNYLNYLIEKPQVDIRQLAWSLHDRRSTFTYRSSVTGHSEEEVITELRKSVEELRSGSSTPALRGTTAKKHLLGVFCGQGAQWATMGRDLISASKFAEDIIDQLEKSLHELPAADQPAWSLKAQLMADPEQSRIAEGELSQPLCAAVQILLVQMLRRANIVFDAVIGHSSGEIGAAYAAGFLTATDAIRIAYYRGLYSHLARGPQGEQGGMLAVGTSLEDAQELCSLPAFEGRVGVAAYNSSSSITLSGDLEAIEEVKEVLDDEKTFNRRLKVDTAYHSHHMIPCSSRYQESLEALGIQIQKPTGQTKWYSSVYSGQLMDDCDALKHSYWVENMVNIVLFATALETALKESRPTLVVEVGPHPALKGPAITVIEEVLKAPLPYTGTLARGRNDVSAMASALAYLWSQFGRSSADWRSYYQMFEPTVIPEPLRDLPGYPWNHDRLCWFESRLSRAFRLRQESAHVLLGTRADTSNEREYRWRNYIHLSEIPWLQGHKIQGQTLFPAAGFLVMAVEAARIAGRSQSIQAVELLDTTIIRGLALSEDRGIEILFTLSNVTTIETGPDSSLMTADYACDACVQKQSENFVSLVRGKLVLHCGKPSPTALIEHPSEEGLDLLSVETDVFYSNLSTIGYNYGGLFKSIAALKRASGLALGEIYTSVPQSEPDQAMDHFLLHPATLDVAFQAIFAAISHPGDGALWSLHIPTTIRRVVLNPAVCPFNGGLNETVRFSAVSNRADDGSFSGCVDIFPMHNQHSLCQVEGLEVSPLSPPTEKDDRAMFGKMSTYLRAPDADALTTPFVLSSEQKEEWEQLDRLALHYLRKMQESTSSQAHLDPWAQNALKNTGGKTRTNDKMDDIDSSNLPTHKSLSFMTSLEILKTIGDGFEYSIVTSENSISPLNNALLQQFYESTLGSSEARDMLGLLAQQIAHRYPHMRILELKAGKGNATKSVLNRLGSLYSRYTCTDTTSEHFEFLLAEYSSSIYTETIDLDLDLEEQGFSPASYDLIIAGNGLHGLKDAAQALRRIRWLLRPGGYLLAQHATNTEAVHAGLIIGSLALQSQDSTSSDTLFTTLSDFDTLLQSSGFSGIDTASTESASPFSVFVSQAVDQQVNAIRSPLNANKLSIEHILIIGGHKFQVARTVESIKNLLRPFCANISVICSVKELEASMLTTKPFVLSLTELDEPFFKEVTQLKFQKLQTLFSRLRFMVWVTQGSNGSEPYANIMRGIVRSLPVEFPNLFTQVLNIDGSLKPHLHSEVFTEELLRLHIADTWKKTPTYNPLWTTERELMIDGDKRCIMRYSVNKTLNTYYNTLRRRVLADVSTTDRVVAITPDRNLQQYRLKPHSMTESEIDLRATVIVQYSLSNAVKVKDLGCFHLSIGTDESGTTVLVPSQHHQSVLTVPRSQLLTVGVPENHHHRVLLSIGCNLIASSLLDECASGDIVVLHEPPAILAQVLAEKVIHTGAELVFITTRKESAAQKHWNYVHVYTPDRDLKRLVPSNTSLFVDFSTSKETGDIIARLVSHLPFSTRRRTLHDYFTSQSSSISGIMKDRLNQALMDSYSQSLSESTPSLALDSVNSIHLQQLAADSSLGEPLTTIDWTDSAPFPASVTSAMDEVCFRPDRTYFFVGMTGSLGVSTCRFMMQHGARYFALSSRRPNIDEKWLREVENEFGAVVKVFALDIANRENLHSVYREICQTMPPIAGVANAALVLRDGLFMESSAEKMNEALRPKVDGSAHLDDLFSTAKLDFFILFSSLIYITGNFGQNFYSAGNAFMVSLVHRRRQRGLVGSVMNLGALSGIGYIARTDHSLQDRLAAGGYGIMSELDYHNFFAEAVLAGTPESGQDPEVSAGVRFVNSKEKTPPRWVEDPKFSHYVIDRGDRDIGDKGGDSAMSIKALLLEADTPKVAFNIILNALMTMLQKKLDLPPTESILSDVAIIELGVDSLVAVDIRSWFSNEFEHDIPIFRILSGATLADLVEDTIATISSDIAPKLANAGVEDEPKPVADRTETNEVTAPLADLSSTDDQTSDSNEADDNDTGATSTDVEDGLESSLVLEKTTKETDGVLEVAAPLPVPTREFVRIEKMTYACTRFWFLRQYLEDSNCFNVVIAFRVMGEVDVDRAQEAVRKLGARHDVLKTAFYAGDDGEPLMGVMDDSLLRLEVEKIRHESEATEASNALVRHKFDIEHGEVIRMRLLSLSPRDHTFIFSAHHIAMDGFSFNMIFREFNMLYQGKSLTNIPAQFTDFAVQQRRDVETGRMKDDVVFWKKMFTVLPDPLPLFPFANVKARLPMMKYEHEEVEVTLDSTMAQQIRALCRKQHCTMFHFFLATLQVFLTQWLETDDLCIGIADANRKDIKTLSTMGCLLNLVPLRFDALRNKASFLSVLAAAKEKVYTSLAHSAAPFELLLEELNVPRSSSHSPLFQAFLDYRQLNLKQVPLLEARSEGKTNFGATAYDIVLDVTDPVSNDITIKWQTQKLLYSRQHAQTMVDSYMRLLRYFVDDVSAEIDTAPLYKPEDVKAAIKVGRGPQFTSEWPETLSQKVDQVSLQYLDDIALRDGYSNVLTYRAMNHAIDQICEALLRADIKPGDKVGVFQKCGVMWVCSLLAIWRSGAVYVPLDLRNGLPRLASIVDVVGPSAILCDDSVADDIVQLAAPTITRIVNIDQVRKADTTPTRRFNQATRDHSAMILSSSGSTGVPKCIEVGHSSLLNLFEGDSKTWTLGRPNVLQQSAYSFDISLDQIMTSLVNGGSLYIASQEQRSDFGEIAKIIASNAITYTMATPSEYSGWINYASSTLSQAQHWRLANIGGEGWSSNLRDSFDDLLLPNLELQNCYGPAESCVWCTRCKIQYPTETTLIPAGRALSNYSLYIVDRKSNVVPTGILGEILIGGAGTAVGYYKNPELTKDKFTTDQNASSTHMAMGWDRVYRTGDKGYLMDDGTLVVQGRITGDAQIKLRGFRIELEDIETSIVRASNGVLSRSVASMRGEAQLSYLVAFVEFADGYPVEDQQAYLARLLNDLPLPQYMRPNMLIPLDRIPLNSHGKVNRLVIASLPLPSDVPEAEFAVDFTFTEKAVRDLWLEILPESVPRSASIGVDSDFFQLGGNSLVTILLQTRIRETFGVVIPLVKIFESSTLSGLAAAIELSVANMINWDVETALTDDMLQVSPAERSSSHRSASELTVVLTGASGFIGRHILQSLIEDKNVAQIHCIAIRHRPESDPIQQKLNALIASSSKVILHAGDLEAPNLGLSESDFAMLAQQADTLIHSGANRSFWSSYDSVRAVNVQSTKELARIATVALRDHGRIVPIHFLSGSEILAEPPTDGSIGYVASKWASEQFLQKFAAHLNIPVHIHRQLPVPEGAETTDEELERVYEEFVEVARKMDELPSTDLWSGHYDLIPADRMARDVVDQAVEASTGGGVYHHSHVSSVRMDISQFVQKMAARPEYAESTLPKIPAHLWVGKAKLVGFRYQFSIMDMLLQDAEGKSLGMLQR